MTDEKKVETATPGHEPQPKEGEKPAHTEPKK